MKKGIDISNWQGNVDFSLVKNNGVEFVIFREGYRNSTDKRFLTYTEQAKKVDFPIIGVYHFSYALNVEQALEEARFCVNNVKKAGLNPNNTIIFYDFEYDTVKQATQKGVSLGKEECNKHTIAFCDEIKRLGYQAGVYTNLDYYKHWYKKETLSRYIVWLADYTGKPDFDCLIQQYSSTGKVPGIKGNVDLDYYYGEDFKMGDKNFRSRSEVVNLARSWIGKNEKDGSYKEIVDIYNSFSYDELPRGVKMQYDWPWCACTWSALAISLEYTDIMPIEISCGNLIERAKKMGCWVEDDSYIPKPGDAILYNWSDNGEGDNTKWPDHIGVIDYINEDSGYMTVIEGNYDNEVKKRTISINGKFIRGFITPNYTDDSIISESLGADLKDVETMAREVISGLWGNGNQRKYALEEAGYNYAAIQEKVNKILNSPVTTPSNYNKIETTCFAKNFDKNISGNYKTTDNLYCRNDAGKNKKALCLIPNNTEVRNYGYYTEVNGVKWFLIQFTINNIVYTGFSSSQYLEKIKG